MANEFIARKGLIALSDSKVTGSLGVTGSLVLATPGGIELGHASDTTLTRASSGDVNIEGNIIYRAGGTDVPVTDGGTGVSTLTDGGILLGSGTGAITAAAVLADGEILIGDGSGDPVPLDVGGNAAITILGTIATGTWEATDVAVAHGGTGVSTLTDGGVLLGSGTSAITAMAVLGDSEMIVGDGSGDPVAESGATLRTSIGVGTGDNVQFAQVTGSAVSSSLGEFGSVTITAGTITGITDLVVADGGTGASTFTDGGVLLGSGTSAITAMAALADGEIIVGDGSGDPVAESGNTARTSLGVGTGDNVQFAEVTGSIISGSLGQFGTATITAGTITGITDLVVADGGTGVSTLTDGGVLLGSGTGAITPMAVLADSEMIVGDGSGDPVAESGATLRTSIGVGTGDSPQFTGIELGHASDTTITRDSSEDIAIEGNIVYRAGGTDVPVADGGTGASSLTDGGILLGSGTGAITALAVLADGEMVVGDGTTDPVAESGATLRTSIGVGTGDSPQFTAVNVGAASDTTLARSSAGVLTVEGNRIFHAGGTDVPVADGGTGASSLTDGGVLLGSGTDAVTAMAVLADGEMIVGDGSTDPVAESGGTLRTSIGLGATDDVTFDSGSFTGDLTIAGDLVVQGTRTELQISQLKVEDTLITVASGSANSSAANGAGYEIEMGGQTNPAITWDHAGQEFDFNYPISGSQVTASFAGDGSGLSGVVSTLNTVGDSGTGAIALKTQTLTIAGGEGIDTTAGSQTVTIAAEEATDSNKGVASFNSTNFTVSSGAVTSTNITINGATVTLGGTRNITLAQITDAGATTTDAVTLSDGAILNGTNNSGSAVSVATGGSETTSVVAQVATGSYQSAHFDYYCQDGTNYRAGTVIGVWKGADGGGTIKYTDFSTPDIGDTSDATFTMDLSAAKARLKFTSSAGTWIVSSSIRAT